MDAPCVLPDEKFIYEFFYSEFLFFCNSIIFVYFNSFHNRFNCPCFYFVMILIPV